MAKNVAILLENVKPQTGSRKINYAYKPNKIFDNRISADARLQTKKIFEIVQNELSQTVFDVNILTRSLMYVAAPAIGELHFDIDRSTKGMIDVVDNSGIRYGINKFMQTVF